MTGFYNDKLKQQNIVVSDTTSAEYFDSNIYPLLITGCLMRYRAVLIRSLNQALKRFWVVTVADDTGNNDTAL